MQHFYVWRFNKWKRWLVIGLFALFTATFLWFERDGTFSVFLNDEPSVLTKGNAEEPNIALTFNISWGEEKVHDILAQLKKENVKATFFVSGEWAERHPDILEKITDDQHELGMLGYRYKSYLEQEIGQVRKDLTYAKEIFNKLGYKEVELLRPPNGHFNKEIIKLAESLNYKVIHWNVNPNDWKNPGTEQITDSVVKQTSNGDILLMHASDSAKQTAGALEKIIPILKNKGFSFVSLSELINQAHAESKLVE
ncbi:polysaccharide deacetylase family sporulation protein PdaB [Virgibacillus halodenitrificans]|uniref:Polysaccharide deacetylase family sporulation protein PdaB n=1 Tax=Virgibacillus halodenitrificans TaxID=1482 RepID=A0ABR7VQ71_VIRHA|nr:polysaccharide deacetylase family sporulation protein PdaB [Virgibacillus halodenitrificans]MBD1224054.1 polysaccharide deacetylase family sporulation protein PdaB [Virgibacillus halodenitrificans]MCG1029524.1 polysaccharide deacetylase family sporulation protein PdaB [Virgibacillus halodenitrificans]MCJ0933136.1 polysaccharide deacetylase family sporulation protein PdaB [Virgibacillus halodenitrificans]MYL58919.1 polysaccharide deacetylase family sporulation protein PdaB [Virgibacillus halo